MRPNISQNGIVYTRGDVVHSYMQSYPEVVLLLVSLHFPAPVLAVH